MLVCCFGCYCCYSVHHPSVALLRFLAWEEFPAWLSNIRGRDFDYPPPLPWDTFDQMKYGIIPDCDGMACGPFNGHDVPDYCHLFNIRFDKYKCIFRFYHFGYDLFISCVWGEAHCSGLMNFKMLILLNYDRRTDEWTEAERYNVQIIKIDIIRMTDEKY